MTPEIPAQIADEALFLTWAVYTNLAPWTEVVAWADGWIERLDVWPEQITEISLNSRPEDSGARKALAELAQKSQAREFPRQVVERALSKVQSGQNPSQIISELYPLVFENIEMGGLELPVAPPTFLKDALYQLDDDAESIDPKYGWTDIRGEAASAWLQNRIQEELQSVLTQLAGGNK